MTIKPLQLWQDNDDGKVYLIGAEVNSGKQWMLELSTGILYSDPITDDHFTNNYTLVGKLTWNDPVS